MLHYVYAKCLWESNWTKMPHGCEGGKALCSVLQTDIKSLVLFFFLSSAPPPPCWRPCGTMPTPGKQPKCHDCYFGIGKGSCDLQIGSARSNALAALNVRYFLVCFNLSVLSLSFTITICLLILSLVLSNFGNIYSFSWVFIIQNTTFVVCYCWFTVSFCLLTVSFCLLIFLFCPERF